MRRPHLEPFPVSIVRVGLSETKKFADGYDAIFSRRKSAAGKKAAAGKPAKQKSTAKKKPGKRKK
jgi:hypothetical protein